MTVIETIKGAVIGFARIWGFCYPSRVVKGMRMGGHMGSDRVTVRNLKVVEADKDNNLLVVLGAVPGAKGGYLLIRKGAFGARSAK